MMSTTAGRDGLTSGSRRGVLIAASAGLVYPVLAIASALLTNESAMPSWSGPRTTITDYYAGIAFDAGFTTGIALGAVAFLVSLVFVAWLADLLGDALGQAWVRSLIVGLAVADVVLVLGFLAASATAVFWEEHGGLSADGILTLHGLTFALYWLSLPATALGSATIGIAIVVTSALPRWFGWAAIAIAIGNGIGFFLPANTWTVVSGLPSLWTFIAAAFLLARASRSTRMVTPSPSRVSGA
jgi:hypothetical protein